MRTVLLVDDEPGLLAGMANALRREPYEVVTAASGPEALAMLGRVSIDVVLSDEHMPGMSGTEFLARVAEEQPDVVRMVLTGNATVSAAKRAINGAGVFRFLEKPTPLPALRDALAAALRERARRQATTRLIEAAQAHAALAGEEPASPAEPSIETTTLALTPEIRRLLSVREREVMTQLADGYRVSEIAARLFISPHTVRNHLKALFRKLDVHSQDELIRLARGGA